MRSRFLVTLLAGGVLATASSLAEAQLYWRADVGYSWSTNADVHDKNFAQDGVICGDAACSTSGKLSDVGGSGLLGAGVGWRINQNLRVDGTATYAGWYQLDKTDGAGTNFKADIKSWVLLANGYYDFPVGWGIPYVGAGIGWAQNKVDNVSGTNSGLTFNAPGGTHSGFAWALMAGVSMPINPALIADVGVRYVDAGKVETDAGNITSGGVTGPTYSGAEGNARAWALTVGLRF